MALIKDKQRETKIYILYVSHDLDTIRSLCQRVAVTNNGVIVEIGSIADVFGSPQHPYTRKLMSSEI